MRRPKNSLFLPNGISSPSALSFSSKALAPQIPSPMQASQLQPFASSAWATEKSDLRRPSCSKIAFKVLESPPRRLVHRMWQARCHVLRGNKRCAANPQRLCLCMRSLQPSKTASLLFRRKAHPSKGRGHRKLPVHLRQIRERRRRDTRCGIPPADEHAATQYAPIASRPPPLN